MAMLLIAGVVAMSASGRTVIVSAQSAPERGTHVAGGPGRAVSDLLHATGRIVWTYAGSRAHGCARVGLCSATGTITQSVGNASYMTPNGGQAGGLDVVGETDITAQDGSARCGDVGDEDVNLDVGASTASLEAGGPNSGDCAGPTAGELADVPLAVRVTGMPYPSFDLRTERDFVAGPFVVKLDSSLVLDRPYDRSDTPVIQLPTPGTERVEMERVSARYVLKETGSGLSATFTDGGPGSLGLTVAGTPTFTLVAQRQVRAAVSAAQALADLHAGKLPFASDPQLVPFDAVVHEHTAQTGAPPCTDSGRAPLQLQIAPVTARVALDLVGSPTDGFNGASVRTHCVGPNTFELAGAGDQPPGCAIAAGSVPRSALGDRTLTAALSNPGAFRGLPSVSGERSGALHLTLHRVALTAGTVQVNVKDEISISSSDDGCTPSTGR